MEKTLEELVFGVEEAAEGGYTAKSLGESIVTEGDTLEDLKRNIVDAVDCHFIDNKMRPRLIRLHMVKDEGFKP
ncbi:MAG: 2-oxoisovalerate dehydrogenase [Candidatus Margulisiibacteriota bacterium]